MNDSPSDDAARGDGGSGASRGDNPLRLVAASASSRRPSKQSAPSRPWARKLVRPLVFAGILFGCWRLAVLVARPNPEDPLAHPYVGVRGASREKASGLTVLVGDGGLARALRPNEAVKPGTMLHFVARAERPRYFAFAYRDGSGQVSRAYPDGNDAERIEPGKPLPIAFPVDDDPRTAVVTAYWSDHPFATTALFAGLLPVGEPDAGTSALDPSLEPLFVRIPKLR